MADAPDSKSGGVNPREGSSPSSGTKLSLPRSNYVTSPRDGKDADYTRDYDEKYATRLKPELY